MLPLAGRNLGSNLWGPGDVLLVSVGSLILAKNDFKIPRRETRAAVANPVLVVPGKSCYLPCRMEKLLEYGSGRAGLATPGLEATEMPSKVRMSSNGSLRSSKT